MHLEVGCVDFVAVSGMNAVPSDAAARKVTSTASRHCWSSTVLDAMYVRA
jgi:hypothetical protein